MIWINFCKGPKNGLWVGCAEYNNGKCFATGRTLDNMVKNVKMGGTKIFNVSARQFILSSAQMETGEFEQKYYMFMSNIFKGKYWNNHGMTTTIKETKEIETKKGKMPCIPSTKEAKKETKYLYEIKDGILYVYEKKLIAKYEVED